MTRKQKTSQNLVQVSTYIPASMKLELQAIAEKKGMSLYAYIKSLLEGQVETKPMSDEKTTEELL